MKSKSVTTQVKATAQYFDPIVPCLMLDQLSTFESVDENLKSVTEQMKATEQYYSTSAVYYDV